jgi:hypothetical protein
MAQKSKQETERRALQDFKTRYTGQERDDRNSPFTAREKNRATKEQRTSHTTSAERKKENRDKVRTIQKPKYETRKNTKHDTKNN